MRRWIRSLESYLEKLHGKKAVRIICMDLSSVYRAIARKHFPNTKIVADRFPREIDPVASKYRGLISLMRRHRHNLKPEQG